MQKKTKTKNANENELFSKWKESVESVGTLLNLPRPIWCIPIIFVIHCLSCMTYSCTMGKNFVWNGFATNEAKVLSENIYIYVDDRRDLF